MERNADAFNNVARTRGIRNGASTLQDIIRSD